MPDVLLLAGASPRTPGGRKMWIHIIYLIMSPPSASAKGVVGAQPLTAVGRIQRPEN